MPLGAANHLSADSRARANLYGSVRFSPQGYRANGKRVTALAHLL